MYLIIANHIVWKLSLVLQSTLSPLGECGRFSLIFHKQEAASVVNEVTVHWREYCIFFSVVLLTAIASFDIHLLYEKHLNLAAEYSVSL